jgi:hypothetical protein
MHIHPAPISTTDPVIRNSLTPPFKAHTRAARTGRPSTTRSAETNAHPARPHAPRAANTIRINDEKGTAKQKSNTTSPPPMSPPLVPSPPRPPSSCAHHHSQPSPSPHRLRFPHRAHRLSAVSPLMFCVSCPPSPLSHACKGWREKEEAERFHACRRQDMQNAEP